jgi:hypothetical protein
MEDVLEQETTYVPGDEDKIWHKRHGLTTRQFPQQATAQSWIL